MMRVDASKLDLKKATDKQKAALGNYADTAGLKVEREAKVKAPWKDKTGEARQTITGTGGWEKGKLKVVLAGNKFYSLWLELRHEKRHAILKPTIERNANEILRGYQKLVRD